MRIISLFAFIFVSTSLLSESCHHAEAIGLDSASHGLLYGGQVVRRYGAGRAIYRGLQGRAEPNVQDNKAPVPKDNNNKDPKDPKNLDAPKAQPPNPPAPKAAPKAAPKDPNPPAPKDPKDPKNLDAPKAQPLNPPAPKVAPKDQNPPAPKVAPKVAPKDPPKAQPLNPPKESATPAAIDNKTVGKDDTTDTSTSTDDQDQQADPQGINGIPTVSTGSLSNGAIFGLVAVGGVFVLVGGLFAFSQRRKNKEMTKSIVSSSAKAWEQQNSAYEIMEEEAAKPIGTFPVIATYTPTLADELDIQPGDTVTILVEYDDGWVQGINETRGGIKGVFPRHCVDMNRTSNKINKNSKRSSSMGVYTGGYTEVDLS